MNISKSKEQHPLWDLLYAMSKAHAEQGARITELRAQLAGMNLPDVQTFTCTFCGLAFTSEAKAEQHVYHSHRGPLPESLTAGERAAGFEPV